MKFESKISGTKVTEFEITPIFNKQVISLNDIINANLPQKSMDWILDTIRFTKGQPIDGRPSWWCTLDWDSIYKLSCAKNYPQYVEEFENYFGENWLNQYIRFNH